MDDSVCFALLHLGATTPLLAFISATRLEHTLESDLRETNAKKAKVSQSVHAAKLIV